MKALRDAGLLRQQAFVAGRWSDADSGKVLEVLNPADGTRIGTVPDMGRDETRRAIEAARDALPSWRAKTARERGAILRRWYELVLAHQDDLARIMTLEQGRPLPDARNEVAYAATFIDWYAEEGKRVYGDVIPQPDRDARTLVLKEPVGVCAAITPWNMPSAMITRKVSPALAAGCTVVLKPAEQTPYSALALAVLAERAGLPAGVMSIVTGQPQPIGAELTANDIVRKLSFTGSTEVGKLLMRQCADTVKKVSLELGGNSPFLVFDDADLDAAAKGAVACKFRNSGQTCVCANRILVQEAVYQPFIARFTELVAALKVGDGFEEGVRQGPLIDQRAIAKIEAHVADAVGGGARAGLAAEVAAGAGPVLHHHRLAERLGHLGADEARDGVGGAGREGHDHADGLGRPGPLLRGGWPHAGGAQRRSQDQRRRRRRRDALRGDCHRRPSSAPRLSDPGFRVRMSSAIADGNARLARIRGRTLRARRKRAHALAFIRIFVHPTLLQEAAPHDLHIFFAKRLHTGNDILNRLLKWHLR
mgnify:CR=1 FL=1